MMITHQSRNVRPIEKKRCFLFACSCLLFFLCCVFFSAPAAAGPLIGDIEVSGLHSVGKEEFLSLLDISTGEPVDAETVRSGIKRAFLKGIFEDIAVEVSEGEKAKAVIRVKERDYIQRIDVSGDSALSKRR